MTDKAGLKSEGRGAAFRNGNLSVWTSSEVLGERSQVVVKFSHVCRLFNCESDFGLAISTAKETF